MSVQLLFVDDELDLIQDMPPVLDAQGISVTATSDLTEALALFEQKEFEAVLLDIAMPPDGSVGGGGTANGRETGIELARRMCASKPEVPIIALTVIRDEMARARMRQAGIVYILSKPADVFEITEAIKKAVAR